MVICKQHRYFQCIKRWLIWWYTSVKFCANVGQIRERVVSVSRCLIYRHNVMSSMLGKSVSELWAYRGVWYTDTMWCHQQILDVQDHIFFPDPTWYNFGNRHQQQRISHIVPTLASQRVSTVAVKKVQTRNLLYLRGGSILQQMYTDESVKQNLFVWISVRSHVFSENRIMWMKLLRTWPHCTPYTLYLMWLQNQYKRHTYHNHRNTTSDIRRRVGSRNVLLFVEHSFDPPNSENWCMWVKLHQT